MIVYEVSKKYQVFPDISYVSESGIIAWSKQIDENLVINAYLRGIFPWYDEPQKVLWWCPNPRAIIQPNEVHISKNLKKSLKNFDIRFDFNCTKVIEKCQEVRLKNNESTWLIDDMVRIYSNIHKLGLVHSVEAYHENKLVGGLYGVCIGKIFCGESMFFEKTNASKACFVALCKTLEYFGFQLIDCQVINPHLISLGAKNIQRDKFLDIIQTQMKKSSGFESWHDLTDIYHKLNLK